MAIKTFDSVNHEPVTLPLTALDRCDRHPEARALVKLVLAFSGIQLCGHCYATHAEALGAQGFAVDRDIREEVA